MIRMISITSSLFLFALHSLTAQGTSNCRKQALNQQLDAYLTTQNTENLQWKVLKGMYLTDSLSGPSHSQFSLVAAQGMKYRIVLVSKQAFTGKLVITAAKQPVQTLTLNNKQSLNHWDYSPESTTPIRLQLKTEDQKHCLAGYLLIKLGSD